jgi:hypothetical protein
MIPKIIWQTYETKYDDLPIKAKQLTKSWVELNNNWQYNYVSANERELFIKKYFNKEWFDIYKSYPIDVMRADLWRYMCLYIHGGIYCDLDILCKVPIESWLDTNLNFFVSEDPEVTGYTQMIFASEPESIFLANILNLIKNTYYKGIKYDNMIQYIINEVGYKIFSKSISNTLLKKNVGFKHFINNDAKNFHKNFIEHYKAGTQDVFGTTYKSWRKEIC